MSRIIKSIKGLFGQTIHYRDGIKVGESWPGLFKGSYEHYDANGKYAGYSDPGIVADLVLHDEHGGYAGTTYTGLLGEKKHYSAERGYVGESWDGLVSETTSLTDDHDSPDTDSFFGNDDW
ncbi:MAG: hypothetical protein IKK75_14830 [Clostridia bacterium]|nr:hypothetical protein [Clostridia bacterium]